MSGEFRILLISASDHSASDMASKIKEALQKIPLTIDFFMDPTIALAQFQQKGHSLIIADYEMPTLSGPQLVREIRRKEGSTQIFILHHQHVPLQENGVEIITLPITDWTAFLGKVEALIPEEIKIHFGLKRSDSEIYRQLLQYARAAPSVVQNASNYVLESPLIFMPRYVSDVEKNSSASALGAQGSLGSQHSQLAAQTPGSFSSSSSSYSSSANASLNSSTFGINSPKRSLLQTLMEAMVLLLLLGATAALYLAMDIDEYAQEKLFLFRKVLSGFTALALLGYFLGKGLEKIILRQPPKVK